MSSDVTPTTDTGSGAATSVGDQLLRQVAHAAHREAFRHPDGENWISLTWQQAKDRVFDLAAGMIAVGVEPEERVAIASGTRIEWVLADLAIMCAGAATTTVYPTTKSDDVGYILADSESRVVFAEDADQVAKVLDRIDQLPRLITIVQIDGTPAADQDRVIGLEALAERGRGWLADNPDGVEKIIAATTPDKLATLIYTSGTTGRPKGVRLNHDNWLFLGEAVEEIEILSSDDVQYLWLPLSHVFGKALVAIQLRIGFATAVDGRIDKIVDGLGAVHPTFMAGAPRIFEKVRARVMMRAKSPVAQKIFDWAFTVGRRTAPARLAGKPLTGLDKVQFAVAHKLVFSKLEQTMGGRIRFFVSGSAALTREIQEWFYAAGLLILEGYGLTESSAASFVNLPQKAKFGTVGPPLPGMEIKLAEDGEILIRGRGVMTGYHNRPEETAEVLVDGWLHTGDIGETDAERYLRITDRKKDLIKTSGGKYVAPQKIEGTLKAHCPYLSQVIIYGEHHNYITALITLDADAISDWAEKNGHAGKSYADLTSSDDVRTMIDGYVTEANGKLERWETIKQFAILDNDLSVEEGEVTPSMKVRRKAVTDRYADVLEAMYSDRS